MNRMWRTMILGLLVCSVPARALAEPPTSYDRYEFQKATLPRVGRTACDDFVTRVECVIADAPMEKRAALIKNTTAWVTRWKSTLENPYAQPGENETKVDGECSEQATQLRSNADGVGYARHCFSPSLATTVLAPPSKLRGCWVKSTARTAAEARPASLTLAAGTDYQSPNKQGFYLSDDRHLWLLGANGKVGTLWRFKVEQKYCSDHRQGTLVLTEPQAFTYDGGRSMVYAQATVSEDTLTFRYLGDPERCAKLADEHLATRACVETVRTIGEAPPRGTEQYQAKQTGESSYVKHGLYQEWHLTGKLKRRIQYVDDVEHGDYQTFDENGAKVLEGKKEKGLEVGVWRSYHPNGTVKAVGEMVAGKRHGKWVVRLETGGLKRTTVYKDGDRHGLEERYFAGEKRESSIEWVSGMKDGTAQVWSEQGILLEKGPYRAGLRMGAWKRYHPNGKLKEEGEYHVGKRSGDWKIYSADGRVEAGKYVNGSREGTWVVTEPSGVKHTGEMSEGKRTGQWRSFDPTGKQVKECTYTDGRPSACTGVFFAPASKSCPARTREVGAGPPNGDSKYCVTSGEVKHGPYTWWYSDGTKREEGEYLGGKKHGTWIAYHDNGQREHGAVYRNGVLDGAWESWYSSGTQKDEGTYSRGKKHGRWTTYAEDGTKTSLIEYKNDRPSGLALYWFDNGKLREESTWSDGKRNGPTKVYGLSGSDHFLKEAGSYRSDARHGAWVFKDGSATIGVSFYEGKFHGKWYRELYGRRVEERTYSLGKLNGKFAEWFPDGTLWVEGTYVADNKHGVWKGYHENGKLYRKITWSMGKLNGEWLQYDELGRIKEKKAYASNLLQGTWTIWFGNGRKSEEGQWTNNVFNGRYRSWDEFGRLLKDESYRNGKKHGRWVHYHANGRKKFEGNFKDGYQQGTSRFYDENGTLEQTCEFHLGWRRSCR